MCTYCDPLGIPVEGELGTIAGFEDQEEIVERGAALCDPEKACGYVAQTGVTCLAPAIGTAHGVYKVNNPRLDIERLQDIHDRLPSIPLVIHGGTGIPPASVRRLVASGAAKFNVSTD